MRTAQLGDTVRFHFTCLLDDGSQVASTVGEDPMELTIGEKKLIDCFEQSIVGMAEGQKKTVHLKPDEVVGERRPELVSKVSRHLVPEQEQDLEVGLRVAVEDKNGNPVTATVIDLSDQEVTLDRNHPLAGEDVIFNIDLIEVL
jgi:peptidylprolyl isomerase